MVEGETNKNLCNSKDELKEKIMAAFIKKTVGKACRRFQSHLEAVVEANGDFFE